MQILKKYQNFLILFAFFCFLFILSIHSPLNLGDDYVYQFLFDQKVLYRPLSEDAVRIGSWGDVLYALKQHYLYWHGRLTNHFLFLSMLYIGKPYSDFITACMSIMLFVLIYWFSQKGEISFHFDTKKLCLILLSFWFFTNAWTSIFIWIGGATNYLYTSVFILLFLLPYLRYFNNKKLPKDGYLNLFMIVGGLITGCTNENSIPPILLLLGIILIKNRKDCPLWMKLGFVSMLIGFLIFFTAPSTNIRIVEELYERKAYIEMSVRHFNLDLQKKMNLQEELSCIILAIERCRDKIPLGWFYKENLYNNCIALFFTSNRFLFLILYVVCGMFLLYKNKDNKDEKDWILLKLLLCFSFLSIGVLIVSPFIVQRSAFFSLVGLVISVLIVMRMLDAKRIEMFTKPFKRFMCMLCFFFVIYSLYSTLFICWDNWKQYQEFIGFVKMHPRTAIVVELPKDYNSKYKYLEKEHCANFFVAFASKEDSFRLGTFSWLYVSFAYYHNLKNFTILQSDTDKFLIYCKE